MSDRFYDLYGLSTKKSEMTKVKASLRLDI